MLPLMEMPLLVSNGIGINSTLWNDHSLDKFGTERKTTPFDMIHTHDSSGSIHVKSTNSEIINQDKSFCI
jgi:hypothetical protein